ncbi:hypothetical protein H8N03_19120 [Ramlibacter sp. USB13]|uniref:Uncharacterized protein n=1 Tax=Ramlibacter cellulosilyticus TaxID=2764187 RepID=A0A923SCK7_9BURK|nr:DUF5985 family protein [Ramlibacter cellulosilyticus]MBC5785066.1 hypothetical protein [Ramlibacter cellulosilyticus]
MEQLIMGAIAAGSMFAGLFFFRFWHQTRDRFFLFFAGSFWLEALNRIALTVVDHANEQEPLFYVVRLISYGLILAAIWQKNRGKR